MSEFGEVTILGENRKGAVLAMSPWNAYFVLDEFKALLTESMKVLAPVRLLFSQSLDYEEVEALLSDGKDVFVGIHRMFSGVPEEYLITWSDIDIVINKYWNVEKMKAMVKDLEKDGSNETLKHAIHIAINHIRKTKKKLLDVYMFKVAEIEIGPEA